jgi:hypothetical protein
VVDAANVIGSRPDGWWRDRAAAAGRLLDRIDAARRHGRLDGPIVVVLEGAAARAAERATGNDDFRVVLAPGSGDDAVVASVAEAAGQGKRTVVVTADRALKERVEGLGARIEAPRRFLSRIETGAS